MAEQLSISINLNGTEQVVSSIGQVKKALKEAEFQALALEEQFGAGSPQVIALRKNIEGLRDKIGDAADATKTFAEGGLFTTAGKALAGVAGGFSAIQGAIGLVGVESKDLEKTLLKVQSAMALSQGIESVIQAKDSFVNLGNKIKDTAITAFKALKGAIGGTGIGLLVISLGLLIANFDKVKKAVLDLVPGLANVSEFIGKIFNNITDFIGATSEASRATANLIKQNEKSIKEGERFLELNADKYDEYTQRKIKANLDFKKNQNEILNDEKISETEKNKFILQAREKANREINNSDIDRRKKGNEEGKKDLEERKKQNEEYNRLLQERASKESDAQQQIISSYRATLPEKEREILNAEDELEKKKEVLIKAGYTNFEQLEAEHKVVIAGITKKYDEIDTEENKKKTDKKLEIEKNAIDRSIELQTLNAETVKEKRDAEILALEEDYRVKIELAKKNGEDTAILEQIKTAKITDINDKAVKDQIAIDKVAKDAKIKNLDDIANLLGGLSSLFGQQTAASKAFTLAQLGIDTASAISSLTRNSEANPSNAVTFGVAGTIQFATGLLRILTNVKKAKDLLSSPKSSVSMSAPSASAPSIAPIQPQQPQAQLTQLNQSSINAIGNQSMRAYVVETDVTSSQQRIAAIQQRARFN